MHSSERLYMPTDTAESLLNCLASVTAVQSANPVLSKSSKKYRLQAQ